MVEAGTEAIGLYFTHVVAEKIRPLLRPGGRVLDFGDRHGRVALHLEAAGVRVARHHEGAPASDAERPFGGAFAEVHDWPAARAGTRGLAESLEPGAPVLVRLLRRPGQTPAAVTRDLGPEFAFGTTASLGLLVPSEAQAGWAEQHPHVFAALCALEGLVRDWPGLRRAGRESMLVGVRR